MFENWLKKLRNRRTLAITGLVVIILIAVIVALICSKAKPAAFQVSDLNIEPTGAEPGQEISISTTVTNTGGMTGSYAVVLKINGDVRETRDVSLAASEKKQVAFTTSGAVAGTYAVDVNGLAGQFTITQPPAVPEIRTWKLTDADAKGLVSEIIELDFEVYFLPGNIVGYKGLGLEGIVTINIKDGQLYTTPADKFVYDMMPFIHDWIKYQNNGVYLADFWFDPSKVIAPDVTEIPYMISIETGNGEAVITYRWP